MSHIEPQIERYVKMSRDDLSGFWFDAYGWIACYFAQLEGLSYSLIEALGTPPEKSSALKLPFQARTDKAREVVVRHLSSRGDLELAEEWSCFLIEAKSSAPLRNKILHNPLSVGLALGDPLHNVDAGIVLVHEAGRPVIKLGAVQQFSKHMLDLNLRMQGLLGRSALLL